MASTGRPGAVEELGVQGADGRRMHAWNLHARESGGPLTARRRWRDGTRRKGQGRNPSMNEQGKSHRPRVPTKPPNEGGPTASEVVEGQGLVKENADQQTRTGL